MWFTLPVLRCSSTCSQSLYLKVANGKREGHSSAIATAGPCVTWHDGGYHSARKLYFRCILQAIRSYFRRALHVVAFHTRVTCGIGRCSTPESLPAWKFQCKFYTPAE